MERVCSMEKYFVKQTFTIKEVMEEFEINQERVAVVVNEKEKVVGVISQGDIVRALVSGISMYTNICSIVKPSFLYVNSFDLDRAYKLFRKHKITMLPVVDKGFILQAVITLDDIYAYLEGRVTK